MADAADQNPSDAVSLTGPVERVNGELTLRVCEPIALDDVGVR